METVDVFHCTKGILPTVNLTPIGYCITLPGSLCGRGTFRKHLFRDRLWRIEFCEEDDKCKQYRQISLNSSCLLVRVFMSRESVT